MPVKKRASRSKRSASSKTSNKKRGSTRYQAVGLKLSPTQVRKLARGDGISINKSHAGGKVMVKMTSLQIRKFKKNASKGKGMILRLSATQLNSNKKNLSGSGLLGNLWSSATKWGKDKLKEKIRDGTVGNVLNNLVGRGTSAATEYAKKRGYIISGLAANANALAKNIADQAINKANSSMVGSGRPTASVLLTRIAKSLPAIGKKYGVPLTGSGAMCKRAKACKGTFKSALAREIAKQIKKKSGGSFRMGGGKKRVTKKRASKSKKSNKKRGGSFR